jgi:hypothetical protein
MIASKWLLAMTLELSGSIGWAAQATESAMIGRWTVTGVADAQQTTSLPSDEVDKLMGTTLFVTSESVQFSSERCERPTFKETHHNTPQFFRREYKIDPRSLRLPNPVTEIAINCVEPSPIEFIYIKDKRHIVFYWRGFFLSAER